MNPREEPFKRLIELIETLRSENGCPWDKKQTAKSMSVYLIEEVYELLEAIDREQPCDVQEELGDVLFHIFFITRLFQEQQHFSIKDVTRKIIEKMIRRHPHVFEGENVNGIEEIRRNWHTIKMQERKKVVETSALESVPKGLPALRRAYRISERAARAGFDWDNAAGVLDKLGEELSELAAAMANDDNSDQRRADVLLEVGDVLFTLVNVARFAGVHPETALTESTKKFEKRYRYMEQSLTEKGQRLDSISRSQIDALWEEAKASVQHHPQR